MATPAVDDQLPAQLRCALKDARDRQLAWDEAWPQALESTSAGLAATTRGRWLEVCRWSESAWRAGFEREPRNGQHGGSLGRLLDEAES